MGLGLKMQPFRCLLIELFPNSRLSTYRANCGLTGAHCYGHQNGSANDKKKPEADAWPGEHDFYSHTLVVALPPLVAMLALQSILPVLIISKFSTS